MIEVIAWLDAELGVTPPWVVLALVVIIVFGIGRLARLITYDDFPPSVAVRIFWSRLTDDGPWAKLVNCYWCLTPWLMLVSIGVLVLSWQIPWLAIAWLAFHLWFALSYATSMLVNRDERE